MAKHLTESDKVLMITDKDHSFDPKEVEEIESKVGKNNVSTLDVNNCMNF